MRLRAQLRRLVASVLVVVYATLAVVGGSLVRCEEAGGVVRIEWRGDACCTPAACPTQDVDSCPTACAQDDDCGGCRDENLADSLEATRARDPNTSTARASDVSAPAAFAPVESWTTTPRPLTQWTQKARAPHPPPTLSAVRSFVLRV